MAYQYTPLREAQQFRLLRLPLRHDRCDLETWSLVDKALPQYTTLSYAWGQTFGDGSHLTRTLTCDGQSLKITDTLFRALARLRAFFARIDLTRDDVYVWIDGICIDQANLIERSAQVALMVEIYSKCDSLIVWLGERSVEAVDAFERLAFALFPRGTGSTSWDAPRNILPPVYQDSRESKSWPGWLWENVYTQRLKASYANLQQSRVHPYTMYSHLQRLPNDELCMLVWLLRGALNTFRLRLTVGPDKVLESMELRGIQELTKRSWFRRKWVIPEMALTTGKPRIALMSDLELPVGHLCDELRHFDCFDRASPLKDINPGASLLENLIDFKDTDCSDPHDHVYALLGLARDGPSVRIDYTQSVESLYKDVACHYVANGKAIIILALATAKRPSPDTPSWVPDWRMKWSCTRSEMHVDALNSVRRHSPGLAGANTGYETVLVLQDRLSLEAWVIPARCALGLWMCHFCSRCALLQSMEEAIEVSPPEADRSIRTSRNENALPPASDRTTLLQQRVISSRKKWLPKICDQLNSVLRPKEVLCFIKGSPIAFVLSIAGKENAAQSPRSYRLEFCIQVDELQWMSYWFVEQLGLANREEIFIV